MKNDYLVKPVRIPINSINLKGDLIIPSHAKAIIIFAHGSGSSRLSPRNNYVAGVLHEAGFATLLFDLLTEEEDENYKNRFNIELLSERLKIATVWVKNQEETKKLSIGFFGASTGAAAALRVAANLKLKTATVVSRGGRPDLTGKKLAEIEVPCLFIVGGNDEDVIILNKFAMDQMKCQRKLEIVPGATHLFEEAGALEKVAELVTNWFKKYLLI